MREDQRAPGRRDRLAVHRLRGGQAFHDDGEPDGDRALLRWTGEHALAEIDAALAGVLRNLPARPVAWLLAALVFPLGRWNRHPDDAQGSDVVEALLDGDRVRERLTDGILLPGDAEPGLSRLEAALREALPALRV